MKHRTSLSIIFLATTCLLTPALAERRVDVYYVPVSHPHEHNGLYFSFSPGLGEGNFQQANYQGTDKLEYSGGTTNIDIKLGGVVARNLILSGDFIGTSMLWPDVRVGPIDYGRENSELRQGLLGLGLTYYFMPSNVFVSGTLGAGGFTYVNPNSDYKSDRGVGFQMKIGREWWVSPRWGVGVSMFYLNQHVNEPNNQDLDAGFFGLLLNTAFN